MANGGKGRRGFASMKDREHHRAIAAKGGKSAHAQGRAHEYDSAEATAAGRKGGAAVAARRGQGYMAEIGRKGGKATQARRRREVEEAERRAVATLVGQEPQ